MFSICFYFWLHTTGHMLNLATFASSLWRALVHPPPVKEDAVTEKTLWHLLRTCAVFRKRFRGMGAVYVTVELTHATAILVKLCRLLAVGLKTLLRRAPSMFLFYQAPAVQASWLAATDAVSAQRL